MPSVRRYLCSRTENEKGFYVLYGGLFFLGLFLGIMFLMVTVMIIFYKQISEGYDDRERYIIMEKVGMSKYRKKSPNNLSGGQKQRVAIAGILAMKPKCIVLDESTAMLDPIGRREVLEAVQELNKKEHITVLWITHYMEEVIEADKLIVMNQGEIVMEGTPRQVFSQVEQLKSYHLDVPQVTMLAHELRKTGLDVPADILSVDELADAVMKLAGGGRR